MQNFNHIKNTIHLQYQQGIAKINLFFSSCRNTYDEFGNLPPSLIKHDNNHNISNVIINITKVR